MVIYSGRYHKKRGQTRQLPARSQNKEAVRSRRRYRARKGYGNPSAPKPSHPSQELAQETASSSQEYTDESSQVECPAAQCTVQKTFSTQALKASMQSFDVFKLKIREVLLRLKGQQIIRKILRTRSPEFKGRAATLQALRIAVQKNVRLSRVK